MRRGTNGQMILKDEKEKFIGVCLGADFVSEHEWDIQKTKDALGIVGTEKKKNWGINGRKIVKYTSQYLNLYMNLKKNVLVLAFCTSWYFPGRKFEDVDGEMKMVIDPDKGNDYRPKGDDWNEVLRRCDLRQGDEFAASWDDGSFAVLMSGGDSQYAQELYNAFEKKDIVFWFTRGSGIIGNSGLCIGIASRLSKDVVKIWKEADEDAFNLKKADEATGLKKLLEKNDKKYFACSAKWINESDKKKSKHPVMYWLNPMDQENNESGWYLVEALERWALGKPNPIEKKAHV